MNARQTKRLKQEARQYLDSLTPDQLVSALQEAGPFVDELPLDQQALVRFAPEKKSSERERGNLRARR